MNQLLKIENHNGQSVVSARELHSFLESKQDFSNWINNRIKKYGFVENQDYTSFNKIIEREKGATTRVEYALTIDTAKELAMVEGNEKGKQARQYFIECERQAKNPIVNLSRLEIAKMLLEAETEKQKLIEENDRKTFELEKSQEVIKQQAPAVKFVEQVLDAKDAIPTTIIAKDLGMSAKALNAFLATKKIIFRQGETWVPYSNYQAKGYTKTKTHTYTDGLGQTRTAIHTYWTQKGRAFIHNLITPFATV